MKLVRLEIKGYRSLFADGDERSFVLDLADGMNTIVGPNNCGKSNVFRALAVALDREYRFDRKADMPAQWAWSKPTVTLHFKIPEKGRSSRERTLLRYLDTYERTVRPGATHTYAGIGEVRLRVTIEGGADAAGERREVFVARGSGAQTLESDNPVLVKALQQFHKCFHFVAIESGQSLESLLEGRFKEILRTVLRDNHAAEFEQAEQARAGYVDGLRKGLLATLTERIHSELNELFPEIKGVALRPDVSSLDETFSRMAVEVTDDASTDLAEKGTGVRGGLIVAILRHLADTAKRSMLFAVEEPETFLHPGAQESLRDDLEGLATRPDVSLLVSSHSPYIVSRRPDAKVFALDKDKLGRTRRVGEARGDEPHAGALGGLFRGSMVAEFLDRASTIHADARGVVVVEGYTDGAFLQIAAHRTGREDLLDGVVILPAGTGVLGSEAGGAALVVMQALLARSSTSLPVVVLLDNDEPGREAEAMLAQIGNKTSHWKRGKNLLNYRLSFTFDKSFPIEAEDLWPQKLVRDFLARHVEGELLKSKSKYPAPVGGWRYDLLPAAKGPFVEYVREHATASDCARWVALLERIQTQLESDTPLLAVTGSG